MTLHIEPSTQPRSLRLSGEVDLSNADLLSRAIEPWLESDGDITLDLTEVVFMDSTGIGVLMHAAKELASRGTLRLVSPGPLVFNVLTLIAADTVPNVEILHPQGGEEEGPGEAVATWSPRAPVRWKVRPPLGSPDRELTPR